MTYLEEILDDWIRQVLGLPEGEAWNYFGARVAIDYRAELRADDRQVVGSVSLVRVGTKSVTARIEMRAPDGRLAAEAETVIVARDPETRGSKAGRGARGLRGRRVRDEAEYPGDSKAVGLGARRCRGAVGAAHLGALAAAAVAVGATHLAALAAAAVLSGPSLAAPHPCPDAPGY